MSRSVPTQEKIKKVTYCKGCNKTMPSSYYKHYCYEKFKDSINFPLELKRETETQRKNP